MPTLPLVEGLRRISPEPFPLILMPTFVSVPRAEIKASAVVRPPLNSR